MTLPRRRGPRAKATEGWPSGLRRTLGKRVCVKAYRGFESHSLRQRFVRECPTRSILTCAYKHFVETFDCSRPSTSRTICERNVGEDVGLATRVLNKLTTLKIAKIRDRGMYADGGGLYLQVAANGSRSWIFRYRSADRERYMGLGSLQAVSLASARANAQACRSKLAVGTDPLADRESNRAKSADKNIATFRDCAEKYISAHEVAWRNPKHRKQWRRTLETYVYPVCGNAAVSVVTLDTVCKILEPIWVAKPETASRVRGRIESVLDWARVKGLRSGDNPARWKGLLDKIFPAHSQFRKIEHHASLGYEQIASFIKDLERKPGVAADALNFLILTAARTGEVVGARACEIDAHSKMWTVPADRMKSKREHKVPLSEGAWRTLPNPLPAGDVFLFQGLGGGKPLSNMAMLQLLRRMNRGDITAHGFRATFRTWAAEQTNVSREVAEAALAHVSGDKVEAAYQRSDMFAKRRELMDAWSNFCGHQQAAGQLLMSAAS